MTSAKRNRRDRGYNNWRNEDRSKTEWAAVAPGVQKDEQNSTGLNPVLLTDPKGLGRDKKFMKSDVKRKHA